MSLDSFVPAPDSLDSPVSPKKLKRPSVTYEAFKAAFDDLGREGQSQSLESLIARVGGSKSTIVRHMEALRMERQGPAQAELSAISPHVVRALAMDMERVVKERTGLLEGRLSEAHSAIRLLTQECEELQATGVEAEERLDELKTALARQAGAAKALQDEIRGKTEQVTSAQAEAETARQTLALAEARLKASDERNESTTRDLEVLRQELAGARRDLTQVVQENEAARASAAALQSQLESKQQVQEYLQATADAGERYRQELDNARRLLATAEAERDGLRERLQDINQALVRSDGRTQQLLEKLLEGRDELRPPSSPATPKVR